MAGRPKKEDSRDNQYRVRLNDDENEMLEYASKMTDKAKSEVFRQALRDYYNKVKLQEAISDFEDYEDYEMDGISLKRVVTCPYCKHDNIIDLTDESDISSSERGMGPETLYEFDFEYCCDSCLKSFGVKGYISEYPVGALNYEEIDTVEYENEDEEDD